MDMISNSLNTQISLGQMANKANPLKAGLFPEDEGLPSQSATSKIVDNFQNALKTQLAQLDSMQATADKAVETYAVGGDIDLHTVMIAAEKADMSMQLALQIRNKMLNAYQEISRMNV